MPSTTAPVSTLRGAAVEVDARRAARVVLAVCLVGLAVAAALLFVAGARKNAQVADLRAHGVPVTVTSTGCTGLLGGSGSNPVGYSCTGAFTFDGQRHVVAIPGDKLHGPGTTFRAVVAPDDPGLVSTPEVLAGEHASAGVYVVPAILSAVLAVALSGLGWARRRRRRKPAGGANASPGYVGGV